MRSSFLVIALVCACLQPFAASVAAQGTHEHVHEHDSSLKIGRVNFPVSCNRKAQLQFNRAVAWLHSFEYEEAEKAFTEVTVLDPACGMGHWGIAMSNYHPLWAIPGVAELQKGLAAISEAKTAGARTARERDYIAATEVFFKDHATVDHRTRAFAFSEAMKQLSRTHPRDNEAAVFYSLTLVSTGMMSNDKTYVREKEAAQILNRVLAREPQHPGVTHYIIHSYDYPALAHLALNAARSYAKIAPASAHARHMPSHIFTRLGIWQEAVQSNLGAEAAAKTFAARNKMPGAWDEQLHAMDYLAYAYLQSAQDKKALGVLDELNSIKRVDPPTFKVAYAYGAIPARYALERRQWAEAAKLNASDNELKSFLFQKFPWAEAHIHFARAIGAARSGNPAFARRAIEELAAIKEKLSVAKGEYDWAKQTEIQRLVAAAWLEHAEGRNDEALRLMREAADLDDATDKHPVTPGAILPAREQLGELLLELKQPANALTEFETSLRSAPNRFNGLYGAARAGRLTGDQAKAKTYYEKLLAVTRAGDHDRPEIEEARTFVAGNGKNTAKRAGTR